MEEIHTQRFTGDDGGGDDGGDGYDDDDVVLHRNEYSRRMRRQRIHPSDDDGECDSNSPEDSDVDEDCGVFSFCVGRA